MSGEMTPLECEVMHMLLCGDEATLLVLRRQMDASRVKERKLTGVGFYTTFAVPDCIQRVELKRSLHLGDVHAEIDGLQFGAGFVLFVNDGVIDFLEGYTYEEPWPVEIHRFKLAYTGGAQRDLEAIRRALS
jgi:hypothetical protein